MIKKVPSIEGDRPDEGTEKQAMKKGKRPARAVVKQEQVQQGERQSAWFSAWVLVLCIGLGAVLYGNSLRNEFVFDDLPLIAENGQIKDIGNVWQVLGLENGQPLYRPVRYVSYMVDYWLWGMNPAGYHAANIVYHGLSGFVLYLVLLELLGNGVAALAGAVLFLSHPVLTDSVTYISGRRDILAGLFYLLGFYWFVRYRKELRGWYAVLTGIFFLLALGSKEMGITLPAMCLVYDFTVQYGRSRGEAGTFGRITAAAGEAVKGGWKIYVPIGIAAGIFIYNKLFLHYPSLKSSYYGGSAVSNFATVVRIVCHYVKLVIVPVVLQADYSYNAFALSQSFLEWRVVGAGVAVGGVLWLVVRSLGRREWVFFGGMWFFITLLPVSQIFPHHELMAEHYLYLPLAGVMIAVSSLWGELWERRRELAAGVLIVVVVLYSARVIARNADWRDGMTLWSGVVAAAPESARGHDNLGTEYFKRKEYGAALRHYQEAVRLRPEHAIFHNNLARACGVLGDINRARSELEQALKLNPDFPEAMNNLGIVYYQRGDYVAAAWLFKSSDNRKPDPLVRFNLAKTFLQKGEVDKAKKWFEKALQLQPDYCQVNQELGIIYLKQGKNAESIQYLQRAYACDNSPEQKQKIAEAIQYAKKSIGQPPQ